MRITYPVMKRQLLMAGMGLLATACSTIEPSPQYSEAATRPASGLVGPRGADEPAGPSGAQAPGDREVRSEILVGPTGLQGSAGAMGKQGDVRVRGETEARGETLIGPSRPQGPVGVVSEWTAYREVIFMYDRSDIPASQEATIAEVAEYLMRNPSIQVGIDNSPDPRGTDPRDQNLNDRRTEAVREALLRAGVSSARIQTGVSGDGQLLRDRRIGLLLSTAR